MSSKFAWFLVLIIVSLLIAIGLLIYNLYQSIAVTNQEAGEVSNESLVQWFTVTRVIDGDTVELDTGKIVRYVGIDTPELHHPQIGKQCYGEEAKVANEALLKDHKVQLVKDVSEQDRYGRLLRYLYREDGLFVNQSLVAEGFAFAYPYPPDLKEQVVLQQSEHDAAEDKKGLWSHCTVTKSTSSEHAHTQVIGN